MALSAKGYRVVPQNLADSQGRGFRHVHLKEHRGTFRTTGAGSSSAEGGDGGGEVVFAKGRTLFVGNIDDQGGRLCPRAIESRLRRSLSSCGGIARVQASAAAPAAAGERAGGAASFSTTKGVKKALLLEEVCSGTSTGTAAHAGAVEADSGDLLPGDSQEESRDENGDETCGYAALIQRHRRQFPPREALQSEVDSTMNRFEAEEAEEAAERKALLQNPVDDDGFVTVTYKRKRGRNSGGDADGNPSEAGGGAVDGGNKKKRKGAGELSDFYRFQMRETKREQLATLRSKFEQDKARVAKMKLQRKFRPF